MRYWYEDRSFPEIKAENQSGPNDILAVVDAKEHRLRLITEHNEAIERAARLESALREAKDMLIGGSYKYGIDWREEAIQAIRKVLEE